jgi:2'-5' RNA ligase
LAQRNEHLVVIMLEPMPAGEEFEVWPRHITIVPWFPCDEPKRLDETLKAVAGRHQKFSVNADKVEEWGKKDKFQVQKIDDPGQLHRLHWDIFHSLQKNGFPVHQKDFLGQKYSPHMALRNRLQKGLALERGEVIRIDGFTLVKQIRLKGTGRMIKQKVKDYGLT